MEYNEHRALPIITLGVASYNNALYIRETLGSIRDLDYPRLQVVVVDDASTDNSVLVIEQWMRENPSVPVQLERHAVNAGICTSLNRVLQLAQGEYMSFIGSDDKWRPDFLRRMVTQLSKLSADYCSVYGDIVRIDEAGQLLPDEPPTLAAVLAKRPEGEVFEDLLRGNFVPAMAHLTRTAAVRAVGGFDESLPYEDWDLWLRLAHRYKFKYLPAVVAEYRIHRRSAMRNPARLLLLVEGTLTLLAKHQGLSQETDRIISRQLARLAQELYELDSPHARHWLLRGWRSAPTVRHTLYTVLAGLGIAFSKTASVRSLLNRWRK